MNYFRTLWLWLRIVGREWESADCGIPEPYRMHYRLTPLMAWQIAWSVSK